MVGLQSLVLACVVLVGTQVAAELSCSPSNSSEMRVTFDSHRNKTGRWTHTIGLEHPDLPRGPKHVQNTVPWAVDVKYAPKSCDVKLKDSVKVLISFTEPPVVWYASDYVFIPDLGYYKYYATMVPWAVAKSTCEQDGAHLAIINSPQEADALKKLVVNASVEWAWIGLGKIDPKGEFVTIFGDPVSTTGYNLWYSGFIPSNAGANSAAVISKTTGTMAFNSNPSATNFVFLCEQD